MMNQNDKNNNSNDTKKGNPAWDQHNKGNGESKNKKHDDHGCGCDHR